MTMFQIIAREEILRGSILRFLRCPAFFFSFLLYFFFPTLNDNRHFGRNARLHEGIDVHTQGLEEITIK